MKRTNILTEIQSNLKKLTDSQLADVADYIEMLMGGPDSDLSADDDKYDDEDYDYLDDTDDGYYKDDLDDNLY